MTTFIIAVPTDAGFIGRRCAAKNCHRYFRVRATSADRRLSCPYCGHSASSTELLTRDQLDHVREAGLEKAKEQAYGMIDKWARDLERSLRGKKGLSFKASPMNYRARPVIPTYSERKVDSELTCSECKFVFQVDGIFGYCPGCRHESLLVYDADISVIRQEIEATPDNNRALRRAYGDLVSTCEIFCRKRASQLGDAVARFQDLTDARRFFKDHGVDILENVSTEDHLTLRRLFQKRHAFEHAGGRADEKYVRMIPEDVALLGSELPLSREEFEAAAQQVRRMLDKVARLRR